MSVENIPFIVLFSAIGVCFVLALVVALRTILEWGFRDHDEDGAGPAHLVCFLALILLTAAAVLSIPSFDASNLGISDSVEYAIGAERIVNLGQYNLAVDGRQLPSRYPPWFSIFFLVPALLIAPNEIGVAIWPVTILALLAVTVSFCIARRISSVWGGMLGAFALLLDPGFRHFAKFPMTDVPAAALLLIVIAYILALYEKPERHPWHWGGLGCLAGMLGAIRPLLFVVLLPMVWLCFFAPGPLKRASRLALVSIPSIVLLMMHASYNLVTFGSALRSGYHFWLPWPYDFPSYVFSLNYISQNLEVLLFYTAVPIFLIVYLAALPLTKQGSADLQLSSSHFRRLVGLIALVAVPIVAFHLLYFYSTSRFYLPLSVLLYSAIGCTIGGFLGPLDKQRAVTLTVLICITAAVVGWRASVARPLPLRRLAVESMRLRTPVNAVIVTGLDPVYVEPWVLRGTKRRVLPYSRRIEFASKVVAWSTPAYDEGLPTNPHEVPRQYLLTRGGLDAVTAVASEDPEIISEALSMGTPVFVDTSALEPHEIERFSEQFAMREVAPALFEITSRWNSNESNSTIGTS